MVTRTPGNKPTYQFGVEGGYTPIQDGRRLTGFNGTVGQRFGTQKKLGVLFGGTYDHNGRGIDDLEPGQNYAADPSGKNIAVINNEDLRYYKYDRTRYGFDTALDYNFKPGSSMFLRGLYPDFHDYGETRAYTANFGTTVSNKNETARFLGESQLQIRASLQSRTHARELLVQVLLLFQNTLGVGDHIPKLLWGGGDGLLQLR